LRWLVLYRVRVKASRELDSNTAPESPGASNTFAERLDYLFKHRRSPSGKLYKQSEVAKETGISAAYISQLRNGEVKMPSGGRLHALARVFGIDPEYFTGVSFDPAQTAPSGDDAVERALTKPLVREMALRAGELGEGERALVLEMMERASKRAAEIRAQRDREQRAAIEHGDEHVDLSAES